MNEEFARNIKQYNIAWAFFKFTIETNLFTRINQELKIKKQEISEENFGLPKRDESSESFEPLIEKIQITEIEEEEEDECPERCSWIKYAERGEEITLPVPVCAVSYWYMEIFVDWIAPLIIGESVMEVKPHNVKLEEDEGGGGNAQFLFLVKL